jgi:hypothetical protein
MKRREFITLLVAATARLFAALAQQSGKVPIIEFLG